MKPLNFNFQSH